MSFRLNFPPSNDATEFFSSPPSFLQGQITHYNPTSASFQEVIHHRRTSRSPSPTTAEQRRAIEALFARQQAANKELTEQVSRLQAELERSRATERDTTDRLQRSEESKLRLQAKFNALTNDAAFAQENVKYMESQLADSQEENLSMKAELQKLRQQVKELQRVVREKETLATSATTLQNNSRVIETTMREVALLPAAESFVVREESQGPAAEAAPPMYESPSHVHPSDQQRQISTPQRYDSYHDIQTVMSVADVIREGPRGGDQHLFAGGETESVQSRNSEVLQSSAIGSRREPPRVPSYKPNVATSVSRTRSAPPPPTAPPRAATFLWSPGTTSDIASPSPIPPSNAGRRIPPVHTLPQSKSTVQATAAPVAATAQASTAPVRATVQVASEPVVASATTPSPRAELRKFNFKEVSKLEMVGCSSSTGYVTVAESQYTLHLVPKTQQKNNSPLPLIRSERLVSLAQSIKMFGSSWFVFMVHDHGVTLPPTATGAVEVLPSHLQRRLQLQCYMRLSQILQTFLEIALALQVLHNAGCAHGNLDAWSVFVPKLEETLDEDLGESRQRATLMNKIRLSGYGLTPSHRNPLYRAPEAVAGGSASLQADTWALGVVFWEIMNYCAVPLYDAVAGEEEATHARVKNGSLTLSCPEQCPANVFEQIISPCFQSDAALRPPLDAIVASIQRFILSQQ